MEKLTLTCPIRGVLNASGIGSDGLKPTEEARRVEAIRYLVSVGYPKENFIIEPVIKRFGSGGHNSFRSDFAVLDTPAMKVNTNNIDDTLKHCVLLCEVKRNSSKFDYVKQTQVKPMLDFSKLRRCVGLYWDNIIQRVYWQEWIDETRETKEGPLSLLPGFGEKIQVRKLTMSDLESSQTLIGLFKRIEDILHQASIDLDKRYEVILQLILIKLFDEHSREETPDIPLEIQDFVALGTDPDIAKEKMDNLLADSVDFHQRYLPRPISKGFAIKSQTLVDILTLLAPVRLTSVKREVIQTFYMKFAEALYKWDLAQYFTPITVTDFIIDVLNPQYGEHIKDPACGSADFLTAAFQKGRNRFDNYSDCIWGSDNSPNAVQVAVLNMLLNGDGKTNITQEDSLEVSHEHENEFNILVCNPPFGKKIVEKRHDVLHRFDLGHEWNEDSDDQIQISENVLDKQETGILFLESCVKQTKPGGRIGIILPNGYLGNRSKKYKIMREWVLRECFLVAICSFPRFTFKSSGADVSASVVFLQKRDQPLKSAIESEDYPFNVQLVQTVGWEVGKKDGKPTYKRNGFDGSYIIGDDGEKILDADFDMSLRNIRNSGTANNFEWLKSGHSTDRDHIDETSLSIKRILNDPDRTMDPKRHSRKFLELRQAISEMEHFKIGDVLESIPELTSRDGTKVSKQPSDTYHYIEISDIVQGGFKTQELRGWEMPVRAKHFAELGDIFIGSIWGSVEKWCLIADEDRTYVVTNGCHRFILKDKNSDTLLDLLSFFCTDSFATQMRALTRGSDGLAEVTVEDVNEVLVPKITDNKIRESLKPFVENMLSGKLNLHSTVNALLNDKRLQIPVPEKRPNHTVLV